MKAYFFSHFMLSEIQKGIQAQHCTTELFLKYQKPSKEKKILYGWAKNHKTTIILNGGNCEDLAEITTKIEEAARTLHLPFSSFYEDSSINCARTCVGIIIPHNVSLSLQTYISQFSLA